MDILFFPEVLQAVAGDNYIIYAYMNDGSVRKYALSSFVSGKEELSALKDPEVFKNSLTVLNGTAAFDLTGNRDETNCVDIDPLVLYNVLNANEFPFEAGVLFRHIKSFFVLRCRIGIFGALLCHIATFLVLIVHLVILAV